MVDEKYSATLTPKPVEHFWGEVPMHIAPQQGPQLTEHTGNRIASALERIADAMEKAAKPPADENGDMIRRLLSQAAAYPLGDPAPSAGANGPAGPEIWR